ncbi:hypothetical protein COY62_03935, partial [bacterium (Candidatus Howlettbacteria) CG_4_10_14_0_8_um_filter_40_9]
PIKKLKAVILFFGTHTDTKFLGKVKLMKLFYFLDFMHVKNYGSPVTYDNYINLEHGPIPSAIKNLVDTATDDVDNSLLADTISIERPTGTDMCRIIPLREFSEKDEKYFSETEMEILNKVCLRFGDKNTRYIEDASHEEAPWKETNLLDYIPYTLAAEDKDCKVSKEEISLLSDIGERC